MNKTLLCRACRLVKRGAVIAVTVAVSACGGDATGPQNNNVSGQWAYSASNVSGSGVSCNISGVSMLLNQSGNTFTGSMSGGTVSCTGPGGSINDPLGGDVVANGVVNGSAVQFDIGTPDIHNVGTLSGNSISGTVAIRLVVGATTVVLDGNFSAVRQ